MRSLNGREKMTETNPVHTTLKQRLSPRERRAILIFGHIIAVVLALAVSLLSWANEDDWLGISLSFLLERPEPWFYLLPFLWLILMAPLYNVRRVNRFQ